MPNVLIGPAPLRNRPGRFRSILESAGLTPIDVDGHGTLTPDELRPALPEADAMIAGGEALTADLLAFAPRLRAIARTGVGYDAIDLAAASARGIAVGITPGTNQGSVAEQTFALLLALARRVIPNDAAIRAGGWDRSLVRPLRGSTLGLVGLGRIGRAVAARALAFEMEVVAYDPVATEAAPGVAMMDLPGLLARADVVSLHAPLIEATRGLFDRKTFALMKPGAIFLNTARGGLVVEPDLIDALTNGPLAGAGLDVLDPEPPAPANPLLRLHNVVFSAHIAGIDTRAMSDMADMAAQIVADLYQGRWPEGCIVNPEVREGWTW